MPDKQPARELLDAELTGNSQSILQRVDAPNGCLDARNHLWLDDALAP